VLYVVVVEGEKFRQEMIFCCRLQYKMYRNHTVYLFGSALNNLTKPNQKKRLIKSVDSYSR